MISGLYWREPLALLLALCPLLWFLLSQWRHRLSLSSFAEPHLHPWLIVSSRRAPGRSWRSLGMALAWVMASIALAGPRTPQVVPPGAKPPAGAVMAVLDLSGSMMARDLDPSRRGAAVATLKRWNASPGRPPFGVVLFAGRAHLFVPPAADAGLLDGFLDQLNSLSLPTLGNNLPSALTLAAEELASAEGPSALVVLSDGDLGAEARGDALAVAGSGRLDGISAFTVVGVGSATPTPVPDGEGGWLKVQGRPVLSRREEAWLGDLAATGGGRYLVLDPASPPALSDVLPSIPGRLAHDQYERVLWNEWFPFALCPALLLFLAALFVPSQPAGVGVAVMGVSMVLAGGSGDARAGDLLAKADGALQRRDYGRALTVYRAAPGYRARFGEGVSCYRLEDYACAAQAFAAAAWLASDDASRGRAAFNLGNSFFRLGDFEQAAVLFRNARAYGVAAADVERNLAFAESLAAEVQARVRAGRRLLEKAEFRAQARGIPEALLDRLAEGIDLGLEPAEERSLPPFPGDETALERLLQKGLDRVHLSRGTTDGGSRDSYAGGGRSGGVGGGSRIWGRLLEIEEGFPARLEAPRPLPGERPW